jgi:hypothetical protein
MTTRRRARFQKPPPAAGKDDLHDKGAEAEAKMASQFPTTSQVRPRASRTDLRPAGASKVSIVMVRAGLQEGDEGVVDKPSSSLDECTDGDLKRLSLADISRLFQHELLRGPSET